MDVVNNRHPLTRIALHLHTYIIFMGKYHPSTVLHGPCGAELVPSNQDVDLKNLAPSSPQSSVDSAPRLDSTSSAVHSPSRPEASLSRAPEPIGEVVGALPVHAVATELALTD